MFLRQIDENLIVRFTGGWNPEKVAVRLRREGFPPKAVESTEIITIWRLT